MTGSCKSFILTEIGTATGLKNNFMSLIIHLILGFVWWVLAFPVVWVIATPFILLTALRGRGRYADKVRRGYAGVTGFWKEHGVYFIP